MTFFKQAEDHDDVPVKVDDADEDDQVDDIARLTYDGVDLVC